MAGSMRRKTRLSVSVFVFTLYVSLSRLRRSSPLVYIPVGADAPPRLLFMCPSRAYGARRLLFGTKKTAPPFWWAALKHPVLPNRPLYDLNFKTL